MALRKDKYTDSTTITDFYLPTITLAGKINVKDASIFPSVSTSGTEYKGVDDVVRYRRVFLPDGEWCYYSDVNTETTPGINNLPAYPDNYILIPALGKDAYSENFVKSLQVGLSISTSSPTPQSDMKRIGTVYFSPTAEFEGRTEFY